MPLSVQQRRYGVWRRRGSGYSRVRCSLMRVLKRKTARLSRLLDHERELNLQKSRFVAMASHEFRTPLTTMLSSVDLIENYMRLGQVDNVARHLQRIRTAVGFLRSLLEEFLSLEKLEQGGVTPEAVKFDLNGFIGDVTDGLRGGLKPGQDIRVEYSGPDDVVTDKRILRSILQNLLSNAIKYSRRDIRVTAQNTPAGIRIAVADDGIGIPKAEQRHLFTKFFRGSNVGAEKGTGLGLTIVQRYLRILHGDISFDSSERGTTFTVFIPLTR